MKRDMTKLENIIEEDLNDVNKVNNAPEIDEKLPGDMPQKALDDTRRVKVLSPGILVAKRFFRNKLAIVGLSLLVFMFAFCFLGGWIIPYDQKEVFYKYDFINFLYGTGNERVEFNNFVIENSREVDSSFRNKINTYIKEMVAGNLTELVKNDTTPEKNTYTLKKVSDELYLLSYEDLPIICEYSNQVNIGSYDTLSDIFTTSEVIPDVNQFKNIISSSIPSPLSFTYLGDNYFVRKGATKNGFLVYKQLVDGVFTYAGDPINETFETTVKANLANSSFPLGDRVFLIESDGLGNYEISEDLGEKTALYASTFVFDKYNVEDTVTVEFQKSTFEAISNSVNSFTYEDRIYSIGLDEDNMIVVSYSLGEEQVPYVRLGTFSLRRYNGEDTIDIGFKDKINDAVQEMVALDKDEEQFTYYTVQLDDEGNEILDGEGNPIFGEEVFDLKNKQVGASTYFELWNMQNKYLINIYEAPSGVHLLGTDGNGMDVLTRIMFGGRISLIIGFIVIFLSIFLGVIMGGVAGYFGKWVDNLIMRLVDIFYCIPTMPILIIMGALFDSLRLEPYTRIMYLMIILGVLGWSGIARLVRGQILSLREQEFMIAAEATGLRASRRIFRHLVPNVMPQLIVNATMGLGGIILTESTLSFLGLGAKYPLATWGAMINSVSSAAAMVTYTYIWIPVGLLICLTVIAFNFVGDGLRDAFDPKMKR